jgi:hypothetical protein
MRVIAVTALPDGWRLTVDEMANDMIFRSGRQAERAARRLADRLARAGLSSEIHVHLKDGSLAARFLCPARRQARTLPAFGGEAGERDRAPAA